MSIMPTGQSVIPELSLPSKDSVIKFAKDFSLGGGSAVVAKTLIAPIERVKLILQLQAAQSTIEATKRYNGMIDCFLRVPREQGFLSFWRVDLVLKIGRCDCQKSTEQCESLGMAFKEFFKKYTVNETNKSSNFSHFIGGNLLAGGLSGCATFFFIYPLDFSRTRLAIDMGKDQTSREFRGLADCLIKIVKHDVPSLQYIFLYRSAYYGLFDTMKVWVIDRGYGNKQNDLSFLAAFAIGQVTTFIAAMFSYPLDTVRRRLTMDAGKKIHAYHGTVDCTKKIYRLEGFKAFYSGAFVNAIRGVGAALILALYNESSKFI
ncbi:ADP/ATP translocase [Aphelenchoides besseyi]|nr:ADP/ATP translocase [Aphelenchoides besseyi]KAI6210583.1 ADP/ATP translocase [Aphelenchoides besseyi]